MRGKRRHNLTPSSRMECRFYQLSIGLVAHAVGQYQREVPGEMIFSDPRIQIELDRNPISCFRQ